MTCPSCRAESPPGSRFCAQCGTEIAVVCSTCGVGKPLDSRFCTRCGAALAAVGSTPAAQCPRAGARPGPHRRVSRRRPAQQAFELEPLPPLTLRGKAEPVVALRAVGPLAVPAVPEAASLPLVGRKTEVAALGALSARPRARGAR